jgi:hypothetical protein
MTSARSPVTCWCAGSTASAIKIQAAGISDVLGVVPATFAASAALLAFLLAL